MSSNPTSAAAHMRHWTAARVHFLQIDDLRDAEEKHLQRAAALHSQLARAPPPHDLEKWDELLATYRATLAKVRDEQRHLQQAQDALAALRAPSAAGGRPGSASDRAGSSGSVQATVVVPAIGRHFRHPGSEVKRPKLKFPNIVVGPGTNVAVHTMVDGQHAWIWAIVKTMKNGLYEVADIENESPAFSVTEHDIIPLPPPNYPDFPQGCTVMACYPDTTAFYKAVVVAPPKKGSPEPMYQIQFFDDDNVPFRNVPKTHVTQYVSDKIDRM
ncbi:hypothetical protein GGF31_003807 [Allomyces arbusculus]|nr:hypothetical protein GGF31_003807 [Allomyces arbusculus]